MISEEKSKAYDKALERARKAYQDIKPENMAVKTMLEEVFPELRESEDEWIPKELIEYLKQKGDYRSCWIAWLKKQKEQKPVDEQLPPLEGLDAIKAKYYDEGFKNGFDEGVDSVKPVEWSEDNKKMLDSVIRIISQFDDLAHEPTFAGPKWTHPYTKELAWLKSFLPSWKASEEDIKMLEHIIGQYETGNKNSKVMGHLPRVEELSFLKKVLSKWKTE